jgi:serine/threonine-protein kinase
MALRTRVWGAGKLLLLGGALLLTYVLFAIAGMRIALKTREVTVPDLQGKSVNAASTLLGEMDLDLKVEEGRRLDPKVPPGHILSQEPQAGLRTRRDRSVRVWVSGGPRTTVIPALVGESSRVAEIRLQQDELEMAALAEIRSSEAQYPRDTVVAQTPAPKSTGTRVALLVNRGERGETYVMPDLIGVNGDRASDVLRSAGFRIAVVGDHPYPGVPSGIVLRQSPQAGFEIARGETISLEVSR